MALTVVRILGRDWMAVLCKRSYEICWKTLASVCFIDPQSLWFAEIKSSQSVLGNLESLLSIIEPFNCDQICALLCHVVDNKGPCVQPTNLTGIPGTGGQRRIPAAVELRPDILHSLLH